MLAKDGTLVMGQSGSRGAAVVTANGVEFHDRMDVPQRIVHRDANEPWRAPVGFILPSSGKFTQTSKPTVLGTTGFAITLRASDTRVPAWGGEVLVRIDVLAPAAQGAARWGEDVAIVLDGRGPDTYALVDATLGQLGGRDKITIVDGMGARVIVPMMPASHRSMILAALQKQLPNKPPLQLAQALELARKSMGKETLRRIVVLSDRKTYEALSPEMEQALARVHEDHIKLAAIATIPYADARMLSGIAGGAGGKYSVEDAYAAREAALKEAVPPSGTTSFKDVILTFQGTPAPSHVLEASGGDVRWRLDSGELAIGDIRAGDGRTEVVRVTVPAWVPGESFHFTVNARFEDVQRNGEKRSMTAHIPCVYDDDIERIANSRHGDVIAYSSALATLKRLDAAFVGDGIDKGGGLYKIAVMHAQSMSLLARDMRDPQIYEQAELLSALLAATK
jgi:hypothetical protein